MLPGQVENPLTKLWHLVACNRALILNFPEFAKLAEIAIVQVLGSVEDENCIYCIAYFVPKLHSM